MVITTAQAREWLRIDGTDNDDIINALVTGATEYITVATGLTEEDQALSPLAVTTLKHLLSLWYDPTQADTDRLQRTVDNLIKTLAHVKVEPPNPDPGEDEGDPIEEG